MSIRSYNVTDIDMFNSFMYIGVRRDLWRLVAVFGVNGVMSTCMGRHVLWPHVLCAAPLHGP